MTKRKAITGFESTLLKMLRKIKKEEGRNNLDRLGDLLKLVEGKKHCRYLDNNFDKCRADIKNWEDRSKDNYRDIDVVYRCLDNLKQGLNRDYTVKDHTYGGLSNCKIKDSLRRLMTGIECRAMDEKTYRYLEGCNLIEFLGKLENEEISVTNFSQEGPIRIEHSSEEKMKGGND